MTNRWLQWAQEIQAHAQAGLEYSRDPFDRQRFQRLREIAVEIVSEHIDLPPHKVAELFANESGYQTPKLDVRAVVPKDGKLLFVRERDGRWAFPGGWAEPQLSLRENLRKEVREESGIDVQPEAVVAILDRNRHVEDLYPYSVYKIFVTCSFVGGTFVPNLETSEARFFGEDELPALSEARTTVSQARLCFAHVREDRKGVTFD